MQTGNAVQRNDRIDPVYKQTFLGLLALISDVVSLTTVRMNPERPENSIVLPALFSSPPAQKQQLAAPIAICGVNSPRPSLSRSSFFVIHRIEKYPNLDILGHAQK